jgi:leucine dehydrogenase
VSRIDAEGYDEVHRIECGDSIAFVALHALIDGRAFGGIRIRRYATEDDALDDALALARAMSRKAVMAGIPGGGAKSVLMEPDRDRAGAVARLGEFIESLSGRYYCGGDLGFTDEDGRVLREATRYVACGELGAWTARSVKAAMEVACEPATVVVQGLGDVGMPLARSLADAGVRVIASDLAPVPGFETVPPDEVYDAECDVFSPCATGGVLTGETIPRLRCRVVCGGANNPFGSDEDADALDARGILYVPDFLSNAGALVRGASDCLGEGDLAESRMEALRETTRAVLDRARAEGRSAHRVAVDEADRRIRELRGEAEARG